MSLKLYALTENNKLTPDVFELIFRWPESINMKPGQFITFLLPEIGGRAYSIAEIRWDEIVLLIKRWDKENWGRGGSQMLCDTIVWTEYRWVGPSGHFVLTENNNNKLFIWTGTGLVPLYNQIIWATQEKQTGNLTLLFWIRTSEDIFYTDELDIITQSNPNFNYKVYLSQESNTQYNHGYTTDYITSETVKNFEEFYICWAPGMIDSATKKLTDLWVNESVIFTERY